MAEYNGWRIVEPKGESMADAVFEDKPVLLVKNSRIDKYGIFHADAIEVTEEGGIDAIRDGNRVFRVSQGFFEIEIDGNPRLARLKLETFKFDKTGAYLVDKRGDDGTIRNVDLDSAESFDLLTVLAGTVNRFYGMQEIGIRQVGLGENNNSDIPVFPEGTKLIEVLPNVCFDFEAEVSEEEPAPGI